MAGERHAMCESALGVIFGAYYSISLIILLHFPLRVQLYSNKHYYLPKEHQPVVLYNALTLCVKIIHYTNVKGNFLPPC